MRGCRGVCIVGGHAWLLGGHAWLRGGMCGCGGGTCIGYDEIRSMSGRYASYWNAFLLTFVNVPLLVLFTEKKTNHEKRKFHQKPP